MKIHNLLCLDREGDGVLYFESESSPLQGIVNQKDS